MFCSGRSALELVTGMALNMNNIACLRQAHPADHQDQRAANVVSALGRVSYTGSKKQLTAERGCLRINGEGKRKKEPA
jgi:hypothetical protein